MLTSTVKDPNILSGESEDFVYSWVCVYQNSSICKNESGEDFKFNTAKTEYPASIFKIDDILIFTVTASKNNLS